MEKAFSKTGFTDTGTCSACRVGALWAPEAAYPDVLSQHLLGMSVCVYESHQQC